MSTNIKEIIDIIKNEYPEYSETDIENAIIEYLENNLHEIISNVKLPEKSPSSFSSISKGFREKIQRRKLVIGSAKNELISDLEYIQDYLKKTHKYDSADAITKDITDFDKSSSIYRATLLNIDTDIARIEYEMEEEKNEDDKTLKKLRDLTNDSE